MIDSQRVTDEIILTEFTESETLFFGPSFYQEIAL